MVSLVLLFVLPLLAAGSPGLRGNDNTYVDTVECTGTSTLPSSGACFGGNILKQSFDIEVTSHDGSTGTVNLKADGPLNTQCDGAKFENQDNAITIQNDQGCGLSEYEYTVRYCPDQDNLIVNLVKPFNIRVVLDSKTCAAGEV
eukprot:Skav222138  [mRNA]  locus=scaffold1181:1037308:1044917:- [translate_table: standard]